MNHRPVTAIFPVRNKTAQTGRTPVFGREGQWLLLSFAAENDDSMDFYLSYIDKQKSTRYCKK
jgi:hypothetical protein